MNIITTKIEKLVIVDVPNLDPITVYAENFNKGQGKLTIECFGAIWSYYWADMGGTATLKKFVLSSTNEYLLGKLLLGKKITEFDLESTVIEAKKHIIQQRKKERMTAHDARYLWNQLARQESLPTDMDSSSCVFWTDIFGEEFWYDFKRKPTCEYEYLSQIIDVVREVFSMQLIVKTI